MKDRPIGVSILAVLHFVGGVMLFGMQVWMLTDYDRLAANVNEVGIPPILLLVSVLFLGALGLVSGVGMWLGTRWGWWLATFYYVYSIARAGNALLTVVSLGNELESGLRGPGYYFFKFSARIAINVLLLLYFFKPNVLGYFNMTGVHRGKAIGALITVTAVIGGIATVVSILAD